LAAGSSSGRESRQKLSASKSAENLKSEKSDKVKEEEEESSTVDKVDLNETRVGKESVSEPSSSTTPVGGKSEPICKKEGDAKEEGRQETNDEDGQSIFFPKIMVKDIQEPRE
jgi:hypothetical protein